ncbi:uncharacterized protein N7515_008673 [Penicillium bovifimosum]|uniref:Uncharacterized protein n=1 Tax=Penicillium bovifimosum TaxID=126998 RepID=A0A9W9GNE9_9EURO|nr:uncharacterized protein N7515_008673 [Penicillium bovifimosum]KAJ5124848.1 hypothetical protein N7515_008673 [Penicillium bovifimosum]
MAHYGSIDGQLTGLHWAAYYLDPIANARSDGSVTVASERTFSAAPTAHEVFLVIGRAEVI